MTQAPNGDGRKHGNGQKPRNILLRLLGPGLVTGAADDDPSGIATYSQAGAQFGYGLLWTVFLTTPFMIAIQLISAQIGRVTGKGLAANLSQFAPRWFVLALVFLLVAANTFNIAADISVMGEALSLVIGGLSHEHALIFAAASVLLQVFVPYRRYAPVLKFMTLTLFVYVITAFTVNIPWSAALIAAIWPKPVFNLDYFMMVVAVLGTTISPYLFFWQASQEVEEMQRGRHSRPLKEMRRGGEPEIRRMRIDTVSGMIYSNLIAYFIVVTIGELHLAPVGLALVSRLAPARVLSLMMGLWFAATFPGDVLGGWLGGFWSSMEKAHFFMMIGAIAAVGGAAMAALGPALRAVFEA